MAARWTDSIHGECVVMMTVMVMLRFDGDVVECRFGGTFQVALLPRGQSHRESRRPCSIIETRWTNLLTTWANNLLLVLHSHNITTHHHHRQ